MAAKIEVKTKGKQECKVVEKGDIQCVFTAKATKIPYGMRFKFKSNDESLLYSEVLELMCNSKDFNTLLRKTILSADFDAVLLELPPISGDSNPEFQFVVLNAPDLSSVSENKSTFESHFQPDYSVVSFQSGEGGSMLVSPCPINSSTKHQHLAAFLRTASDIQIHDLFVCIGSEVDRWLCTFEEPVWVSTESRGVPWLHVRLDSYPRYYNYRDFFLTEADKEIIKKRVKPLAKEKLSEERRKALTSDMAAKDKSKKKRKLKPQNESKQENKNYCKAVRRKEGETFVENELVAKLNGLSITARDRYLFENGLRLSQEAGFWGKASGS